MIPRPIDTGSDRLGVLLDLAPDGSAELITDAGSSTEYAEALRRLRAWCDRRDVDELLAEAEREGGGR